MATKKIWADLLHVSLNEWGEEGSLDPELDASQQASSKATDHMVFHDDVWAKLTDRMKAIGMNMCVLDLGDAVRWPSHPEIALKDAWSPERLQKELARLRSMGLEPIPKLNFATSHHAWLKQYGRMVSTQKYYQVCADLIKDVYDLFGTARFMHVGFDEEMYAAQEKNRYVVIRRGDLWWHDLLFLAGEIEKRGGRAWIWCDKIWHNRAEFKRRMPKSIVQSSWYYFDNFSEKRQKWDDAAIATHDWLQEYCSLPAFIQMGEWGYDQIPCGSNVYRKDSFAKLVKFVKDKVRCDDHLLGFLMAPWGRVTHDKFDYEMAALDQAADGIKAW